MSGRNGGRSIEIREEWRFWRMLEERLRSMPLDAEDFAADMRFQKLVEREENGFERIHIRLAWRSSPNWRDVPLLLLDASADPDILRKVFPTPSLRVADPMPDPGPALNVRIVACVERTFAPSSLLIRPGDDELRVRRAQRAVHVVREIIEGVSLAHGYGRVLVGGPKAVLFAVKEGWNPPVNVDWAHFGAMRGLDMFKAHAAAVSIGRMEPPIWEVDAAAAALSYDDDAPEAPFDARGDGRSPSEPELPLFYPLAARRLRMRDGSTLAVPVPENPGSWGRRVQAQIREEEQRQFLGRLRPIHRRGRPPVWYCLSSVVPEGLVVDDICSSRDLFEERFLRLAREFCKGRGLLRRLSVQQPFDAILDDMMRSIGKAHDDLNPVQNIDLVNLCGFSHALSCLSSRPEVLARLAQRSVLNAFVDKR